MRLLQICANVKSAPVRRSTRDVGSKCRRSPHNLFNFNALQGYSFLLLQHIKQNSHANIQEWATVSTAFSTEAGVSSLKEEELQG